MSKYEPIKPKAQLEALLIAISRKQLVDNCYIFLLEDTTLEDAQKYVHRMRVELSRLRDKATQLGYKKRKFKLILDSINMIPTGVNSSLNARVSLRFKEDRLTEISADLAKMLSAVVADKPGLILQTTDTPVQPVMRKLNVKVS